MSQMRPRQEPEASIRHGHIYFILLVTYLGFAVYGSLVPLEFRYVPFEQAIRKFREIPYFHLGIQSRSDLVANFLLFIPLAFLAMGAFTQENRRRCRLAIAFAVSTGAVLLSAVIEFTQIYFAPRTVSQNDIFAEAGGGIAGVLLWFCFGKQITRWARSLWKERAADRLAVKILIGYTVFLILYQTFPFDLTISPAELYHKLKASRVTILPFCDPGGVAAYTILSKTVVMIPIGYLLMLLRRRKYPILSVVLRVCLLSALIEGAQLFVFSRYSSTTDVVLGAFGGLLGAGAAVLFGPAARRPILETTFWRRRGIWIKLSAAAALVGGLVWEKWHPFDFRWPPEGLAAGVTEILAVPFARQYFLSEFLALAQVVREFTTFFILGMLLRSLLAPDFGERGRTAGRAGKIGCTLLVAIIAVALEFGQVFLPSRTADLTAMAISGIGGVTGIRLFQGFVNVFLKTKHGSMSKEHTGE